MGETRLVELENRGLLAVTGQDARTLLQGIISNDAERPTADCAIYATLLTPQGKFLHDFFVYEIGGVVMIECEGPRLADLAKRLTFYRLRAAVEFTDRSAEFAVLALVGPNAAAAAGFDQSAAAGSARPLGGGIAAIDPRLAALGARLLVPAADAAAVSADLDAGPGTPEDYDRHRLALGVPDGSRDMAVEKSFLLENNIEDLNGVDFRKGCYVGQELTARTKYRGNIRKRLYRVHVEGPLPEPGSDITVGGKVVGEMRSGRDGVGLALLRREDVEKAGDGVLEAGQAKLRAEKPEWAEF